MPNPHKITPNKLGDYEIVMRAPFALLGVKKLEKCCLTWELFTHPDVAGLADFTMTRTVSQNSRRQVINTVANHLVKFGDPYDDHPVQKSTWTVLDTKIPVMPLETVPGTDAGSIYRVIAFTTAGVVAYYHGSLTGTPRIRITKQNHTIEWPFPYVNEAKKPFSTSNEKHISNTGGNNEETIKLVAIGLDNILALAGY